MKKYLSPTPLKILLTFLVILAFSVAGYFATKPKQQTNQLGRFAEVSLTTGKVEKSEKNGFWQELKASESVKENDRIRVSGEGKAIITLDDGSAIRLNGDSTVRLKSLDPNSIQINNEKGEVYTRVVKADRPFVVNVDEESFQALGTAYKTVNSESEKGVYVYQSKVKAKKENKEVPEGKKLYKKYEKEN